MVVTVWLLLCAAFQVAAVNYPPEIPLCMYRLDKGTGEMNPGFSFGHDDAANALDDPDCGFLVTYAVQLPGGGYELCVQANDQTANQSWEVIQWSPQTIEYGSNPNTCWTFPSGANTFTIFHYVQVGEVSDTCFLRLSILPDSLCQDSVVNANAENCDMEAIINVNLSGITTPYVMTFGDGSLAVQSSSGTQTHIYSGPGIYEICWSYWADENQTQYITCCDSLEVKDCICPEDVIYLTSVEPCTWEATMLFVLNSEVLPITVDFGDGTSNVYNSLWITHDYPEPGAYYVCYSYEAFPGDTLQCCEWVNIPGCCLDASFELGINPTPAPPVSCLNPKYMITNVACQSNIVETTHIWTFSDSTVYYGTNPPDHLFTNFVNDTGWVSVTHTIICCEDTVSYTAWAPHTQGAWLGQPEQSLSFSETLPFTGETVLEFIYDNAGGPVPLIVDGRLIADRNASFIDGTWNMALNSVVEVKGGTGKVRDFSLDGTVLRSAVRLPGGIGAGCCRWQGIQSNDLTNISLMDAWIMDANYAIRYPAGGAGDSNYPALSSVTSHYINNYYGIKSESKFVNFIAFSGNEMKGTHIDPEPEVCDCNAVNAIDFRDVNPLLTIKIDAPSNGANTIFHYEKAFNFVNTKLFVRGFDIYSLQNFNDIGTLPSDHNNGPGPEHAAIGIDYTWTKSNKSSLDLDRMNFSDFEGQNARSVAVRNNITGGLHALNAIASQPLSSIATSNIAGGYELSIGSGATIVGKIQGNAISTNGGPLFGFGINGIINSGGNNLQVLNNLFSIGSNTNSLLNGGILLASAMETAQQFRINDNTIEVLLPAGAGIGITNAFNSNVRRNTLTGAPGVDGILLREGRNGRIDCNNIQYNARGISVVSSSQNRYGANYLLGNQHDMVFAGDAQGANGSDIRWNTFHTSTNESLYYNAGAVTGPQHHRRYNSWLGQFGTEARHLSGPSPFAEACQFWYPAGAAVGSIHRPASLPGLLFDDISGLPELPTAAFCQEAVDEFGGNPPLDSLWDPKDEWALLVGDTALWDGLAEAEQTFLRQEIYGLLLEHPDWMSGSTTLSDFQAAEASGFVGQSETLKRNWQALLQDISGHQASLAPARQVLDSLSNLALLWVEAMHTDTTLQDSLSVLLAAVLADGDSLTNLLEQADALFFGTVQDSVGELLSQNAALDDTEWHTWYEKRYNEIALKWLAGSQPDSTASADLRTIAQTCLAEGGRAVLGARGLCEVWLREHYSEDGCQSIPKERSARPETQAEAYPELTVVPNPASDVVRIYLNIQADRETMQVKVLNMNGQLIYGAIMPENGELAVPVRGWNEGVYILSVTGGSMVINKTFVVQRR